MNYPFTQEQFLLVITNYNISVWPAQILFYLLALVSIIFLFRFSKNSSRIISIILAFFWLWMGIVYHGLFFTEINPAARIFATAFIIQGLLLIYYGIYKDKLDFHFRKNISSYIGLSLMGVGLIIYPLIGYILNHRYPDNPTFGLPCPTTIFTLGMILLASQFKKRIIVIPFLWSIVGFMAAISFGIKEDTLLLLSGIIALIVTLIELKKKE